MCWPEGPTLRGLFIKKMMKYINIVLNKIKEIKNIEKKSLQSLLGRTRHMERLNYLAICTLAMSCAIYILYTNLCELNEHLYMIAIATYTNPLYIEGIKVIKSFKFIYECVLTKTLFLDVPVPGSLTFQDPCTPSAIAIQDLFWKILIILNDVFIFVSTLLIITLILFTKKGNKKQIGEERREQFNESTTYEFFVTAFSSLLLLFIGIPGIGALYALEEALTPVLNIKVVGKQWQWSYELSDYTDIESGKTISFDSAPIFASDDITDPVYRLLSVDNNLVVPANIPLNFVITSADVIHSWAVPAAGIKMDAVPGRLNSFTTVFNREGKFYGQCSELCGQGHSLMPICVHVVNSEEYIDYIKNKIEEI